MTSESSQQIIFHYQDGTESTPLTHEHAEALRSCSVHTLEPGGIPECSAVLAANQPSPSSTSTVEPFHLSIPWAPLALLGAIIFVLILYSPEKE